MTINEMAQEFANKEAKGVNRYLVSHSYYCGAVDYINKACNLWEKHILKADITSEEFEQLLKGE